MFKKIRNYVWSGEQDSKEEKTSNRSSQYQHSNYSNNSSYNEIEGEEEVDDEDELEDIEVEEIEDEINVKYNDQLAKIKTFRCLDKEEKPLYIKSVYKISADAFIALDLDSYKDQRAKDGSHINSLKEGIASTQDTFHNFNIYHIEGESFTIADGQHRYEALKRLNKSVRKGITVWIFVYEFDVEDDEYNFELFTKINTAKGINKNELDVKAKARNLTRAIQTRFGKYRGYDRITEEKTEQQYSHWWRISYLQLNNYIETNWSVFERFTEVEILERLERYNKRVSDSPNLFIKKKGVTKDECKNKCISFNFFLGVNFPQCFDDIFKAEH